MKTFVASRGAHTSGHGFVNFLGESDVRAGIRQVWREHPAAVVIDGDDDWSARPEHRPQKFASALGGEVLAYFHSGISGITKSGVVVSHESFEQLEAAFAAAFGRTIEDAGNKVYRRPDGLLVRIGRLLGLKAKVAAR